MSAEAWPRCARRFCHALRLTRCLLGLAWLVLSSGCHAWSPQDALPRPPADEIAHLRLVLRDGSRVELWLARVKGDSVVGAVYGPNGTFVRQAIPVAQLQRVEVRHLSTGRTVALVSVIAVAAGLMIVVAATAAMYQ